MNASRSPAFKFSDGVLLINTPQAEMRIQWQPQPLAEELVPGRSRWRVFWPEFRLLRPLEPVRKISGFSLDLRVDGVTQEIAAQKAAAFAAFRAALPSDMVRVADPFGSHQWPLLLLLYEQPRAMDLAISNPVLAYCLANNDQFRGTRIEAASLQAICHSHRKQRAVLDWLGFPGTEAMVRLMRKIPPESATPSLLRRLRNAIKDDNRVLILLNHLRVVNASVLELVINQRLLDVVTPKLLLEVSGQDADSGGLSTGDAILGALALLHEIAPGRLVKPFNSIRQVRLFQQEVDTEYPQHLLRQEEARRLAEEDRLRQRAAARQQMLAETRRQRKEQAALARCPFPGPPVPGTPDIIPLTSADQVRSEGREQQHCVGSYVRRIILNETYIYRVMAPERATLSIVRGATGCWQRSELKAKRNQKVEDATVRQVDTWLARYRVSL